MINRQKKKSRFLLNRTVSMNEQLTGMNSSFSHTINQENEEDEGNVQKKQVKRQIGIFEEFKIKYDELRKQNQQKRNEIDELRKVNKRLEIQLLNINTQFYDKEIKRLRAEVDKLQEETEDFKFEYFESQNKKKQLESTLAVTQKQMTKIIKQFESEKVQNAQLKHQLKQNQKNYMHIISTVQQSSDTSAKRYADSQAKLNTLQNQFKICKKDLETSTKNLQQLQKIKNSLDQQHKKNIEKLQIQIKNVQKHLEDSEDQSRSYRAQISTLKENISQISLEMSKLKSLQQFETSKSYEKVSQFRSSRIFQIQNKHLKQEIQTLRKQVESKTNCLKSLQHKLNEAKQQAELEKKQNDQKLVDLLNKKTAIQKHYEAKHLSLTKQIQILKIKSIRIQTQKDNNKHHDLSKLLQSQNQQPIYQKTLTQSHQQDNGSPLLTFQKTIDELLQTKDKQILLLQNTLQNKIQEIYELKQKVQDAYILIENLKNQNGILDKKLSVQANNLATKNQIEFLEMRNKIQSVERKLSQTEAKLQAKVKEVKQKDSFIVDSIIGRVKRPEEAPLIMVEMQRILESSYIEKLSEAENKIKTLQLKLSVKTS